jgi:hypothetical protein
MAQHGAGPGREDCCHAEAVEMQAPVADGVDATMERDQGASADARADRRLAEAQR